MLDLIAKAVLALVAAAWLISLMIDVARLTGGAP